MEYKDSSKKIKFYNSIKFKTTLFLVFIVAIILSIYGFSLFNLRKQNLLKDIYSDRSLIIERLKNFSTDALLIEDTNFLDKITSIEIKDQNVTAIIYRKINRDFYFGKVKLNSSEIVNYDPLFYYDTFKDNSTIVIKKNIYSEEIPVASLEVYFSNRLLNDELLSLALNIYIQAASVEIAIIIIIIFSFNFLVIKPLEKIKLLTRNTLQGKFKDDIKALRKDEIGAFNLVLNTMLHDLFGQKELILQRERKYKSIFNKAGTGIALIKKGRFIECNSTMNEIYGLKRDQLLGKNLSELFPADQQDSQPILDQLNSLEKQPGKRNLILEMKHQHQGGKIIDVEYQVSRIEINEREYLHAVVRDVTEKNKLEKSLKENEQKFRLLVESAPDIIFNVSLEGEAFTLLNPAFEKITQWKCEEWIGKPFYTIIHSEDLKKVEDMIEKIKSGETAPACELRILSKSGYYLTSEFISVPQWNDGNVVGFFGSARDITQMVESEKEFKRDYDFVKNIVNHMADPLYVKDDKHRWIFINDAFCDFIGLPHNELIEKSEMDFLPKEEADLAWKRDDLIFSIGVSDENEENFTDANHFKHTILTKKSTFTGLGGETFLIGIIRDITERKMEEDLVKASLYEKEILLKEIHHRVKNNLQIISSLLHIQATYVKDPESLKLFKNSQTRVRSMALIHEKLYQSKNLARINFAGYVHDIATHLFRIYHVNINAVALRIEIPKEIYLSVDTAIPCGLIINEILTNSLKYGFNHKKNGEVFVIFCNEKNNYKLIIGDDGDKIPENIDFRNVKTLGLQLVSILANQLKGSLEMKFNERKEFSITFPAN